MKEKKWILDFERKVWGFIRIEAKNKAEALKKFLDGDYDMFDNKSEEEWEKDEKGEYNIQED